MNSLKDVIREVHRRSLWQVLGIFLAASWGVLQVVEVLTESAGLPAWTPAMALVLLVVGLPVVLATAFVQEGLPGKQTTDAEGGAADSPGMQPSPQTGVDGGAQSVHDELPAGPANLAAGTGSLDRPTTRPSARKRFFTWKHAVVGGLGAFTLLGLSIFGYFVMWSSGIGPVGNLVAQGMLEESDEVLLAEFQSRTDDPSLGTVVTEALSVDLGESDIVRLAGPDRVSRGLRLMERDPTVAITSELAREVAVRQGIKAVIEGEISSVGSQYLMTARIVRPESGEAVASFRENAEGDDDLLPAIDRLSTKLREKLGESLRSIRAGQPLEKVTTASLEALRKYTEGERLEEFGDYDGARRSLNEAVALDTAFAMGYRKLAVLAFNQGFLAEAIEAAEAALRHRDRLTDLEGYLAEATYHNNVTLDNSSVIAAYEAALRIDPDASAALNNLGNIYMRLGSYEEALTLYERAMSGPGASSVAAWNLTWTRARLGDLAGSREALAVYQEEYPGHIYEPAARQVVAIVDVDSDSIHSIARDIGNDDRTPFLQVIAPQLQADADVYYGRIREALLHWEDLSPDWISYHTGMREWTSTSGAMFGSPGVHLWILDDRQSAPRRMQALLDQIGFEAFDAAARPWDVPILGLAQAGHAALAREYFDRWVAEVSAPGIEGSRDIVLAGVLVAEGDLDGALDALERGRSVSGCGPCGDWVAASLFEARGDLPEAIHAWERLADRELDFMRIAFARAVAAKRLGPLYELTGDPAKAIEAYQTLVDNWADGDPLIQPQVERARARIAALGG